MCEQKCQLLLWMTAPLWPKCHSSLFSIHLCDWSRWLPDVADGWEQLTAHEITTYWSLGLHAEQHVDPVFVCDAAASCTCVRACVLRLFLSFTMLDTLHDFKRGIICMLIMGGRLGWGWGGLNQTVCVAFPRTAQTRLSLTIDSNLHSFIDSLSITAYPMQGWSLGERLWTPWRFCQVITYWQNNCTHAYLQAIQSHQYQTRYNTLMSRM